MFLPILNYMISLMLLSLLLACLQLSWLAITIVFLILLCLFLCNFRVIIVIIISSIFLILIRVKVIIIVVIIVETAIVTKGTWVVTIFTVIAVVLKLFDLFFEVIVLLLKPFVALTQVHQAVLLRVWLCDVQTLDLSVTYFAVQAGEDTIFGYVGSKFFHVLEVPIWTEGGTLESVSAFVLNMLQ